MTRSELHGQLALAAVVRSLLTMAFVPVSFLLAGIVLEAFHPPDWVLVAVVFGPSGLFCWLLTITVCRKMVKCPDCNGSLWELGTGNFKPRRMRVRPNVGSCPHCGARIAPN